jgi:membrane associated rhomboid family serine protease
MLPMTVFVLVVCGLVVRRMSSEERIQLVHKIIHTLRAGATIAGDVVTHTPSGCDEFYAALRTRTRWTLLTPALVVAFVATHVLMRWSGSGELDDRLLQWGASVGPLTTNAEWSRLVTAMFVHRGWLHLLADIAGLLIAGALVERLAGHAAFAFVFFASGLLGGLWQLAARPVSISAGAASAIFGLYGLLAATMIWGLVQRSPVTIPMAVLKRVWPGALVFLVYHFFTEGLFSESMQAGAMIGFIGGLILTARVSTTTPPLGRVCATSVASFAILIAFAVPLRGIANVPAELSRVIDVEQRTAARYDADIKRFRNGRMTAEELAEVADAIYSEVRQRRVTLAAMRNVPAEQLPMLQAASRYLHLREDSWRLRVEALSQGRMQTLQKASVRESEAMRVFETVVLARRRS